MTSHDRWVTGVGLLRRFLQEDLAIARALKERRWADLAAVAEIAQRDVDPELAATDPALYRALRDALTLYHLRGLPCARRRHAASDGQRIQPA